MELLLGLALPFAMCVIAYLIARNELGVYQHGKAAGWDVFVYSKGRLWRRMIGVGFLVATAVTLAAHELFPASTPQGASIYLVLFSVEVLALLVLPIVDLWETGRTAKPGDIKRQEDPDR